MTSERRGWLGQATPTSNKENERGRGREGPSGRNSLLPGGGEGKGAPQGSTQVINSTTGEAGLDAPGDPRTRLTPEPESEVK